MGRSKRQNNLVDFLKWTILLEEALIIQLLQESKNEVDFCSREVWQSLNPISEGLFKAIRELGEFLDHPPDDLASLAASLESSRRLLVQAYLSVLGQDSSVLKIAGEYEQALEEESLGDLATVPLQCIFQLTSLLDKAKQELDETRRETERSLTSAFALSKEPGTEFTYEQLLKEFQLLAALRQLIAELDERIDDAETSVPTESTPPSPIRGEPLYHLIRHIQSFYLHGSLPIKAKQEWVGMLQISDESMVQSDDAQNWEFYNRCERLREWACSEIAHFCERQRMVAIDVKSRIDSFDSTVEQKLTRKPGPKQRTPEQIREDELLVFEWQQTPSEIKKKAILCRPGHQSDSTRRQLSKETHSGWTREQLTGQY